MKNLPNATKTHVINVQNKNVDLKQIKTTENHMKCDLELTEMKK